MPNENEPTLGSLLRGLVEQSIANQKDAQEKVRPIAEQITGKIGEIIDDVASNLGPVFDKVGSFSDADSPLGKFGMGAAKAAQSAKRATPDPVREAFRADRKDPEPAGPESNDPEAVAGLMALRMQAAELAGLPEGTPDILLAAVLRQKFGKSAPSAE